MLIKDLNLKRTKEGQAYWTFSLELQCGSSSVKSGGWRYYEDSQKIQPPMRVTRAGMRQTSWLGSGAHDQILKAVRRALEPDPTDWDAVSAALDALVEQPPDQQRQVVEALENTGGSLSAAILWAWRRYHENR